MRWMKCNVLNENEISTNYEIYKIVPMAKFPLSLFIKETQYNFQFFSSLRLCYNQNLILYLCQDELLALSNR